MSISISKFNGKIQYQWQCQKSMAISTSKFNFKKQGQKLFIDIVIVIAIEWLSLKSNNSAQIQ
jgi:hypothetical protein